MFIYRKLKMQSHFSILIKSNKRIELFILQFKWPTYIYSTKNIFQQKLMPSARSQSDSPPTYSELRGKFAQFGQFLSFCYRVSHCCFCICSCFYVICAHKLLFEYLPYFLIQLPRQLFFFGTCSAASIQGRKLYKGGNYCFLNF